LYKKDGSLLGIFDSCMGAGLQFLILRRWRDGQVEHAWKLVVDEAMNAKAGS
jgi:hypothetical protein